MKETILLYNVSDEVKEVIKKISAQLDIVVKDILKDNVQDTMGYILGIPGYEKNNEEYKGKMDKEFVFFAYFSEEQLDIMLELFKAASVPYIPYKAMLTEDNVNYRFSELYENVENEYAQITREK